MSNLKHPTNQGRGGVRKGSGRKAFGDPSQVRSERVMFVLTKRELAELKSAAGDVPLSAFVRKIVLRALKRRK